MSLTAKAVQKPGVCVLADENSTAIQLVAQTNQRQKTSRPRPGIRELPDGSESSRTQSGAPGRVRFPKDPMGDWCLGRLGRSWVFGVVVGFWAGLGRSGPVWAGLGRSGPVWAGLVFLWCLWVSGPVCSFSAEKCAILMN
jgi:hypothetical protein